MPPTKSRLSAVSLMENTRPRYSSSISTCNAVSVTIFTPWVTRLTNITATTVSIGRYGRPRTGTSTASVPNITTSHVRPPMRRVIRGVTSAAMNDPNAPAAATGSSPIIEAARLWEL